jgi:hypothetical protein
MTRRWIAPFTLSQEIRISPACISQVNYINAHATSTIVGDLAEVNAVKKCFAKADHMKMNGTKVRLRTHREFLGPCCHESGRRFGTASGLVRTCCYHVVRVLCSDWFRDQPSK